MALSRSTVLLGALGVTAGAVLVLRRKSTSVEPSAVLPSHEASAPTDAPRVAPKLHAPPRRTTVDVSREVLRLTNELRARGGSCGGVAMGPVGSLAWDDRLAASALAHAKDMAAKGYFAHVSPSGSRPEQRMAAAGWTTMPIGENIASGQASPAEVMQGWIESPGHCRNLLDGGYKHLGVAYFYAPDTQYKHYWVQNFGG